MHKTLTRNLRFGCGASLYSAFLYTHRQPWREKQEAAREDEAGQMINKSQPQRDHSK